MSRWGQEARFAEPSGVRNLVYSSDGSGMSDLFTFDRFSVGPAVTDITAMQVGTVYACLERLGGAVLQLPLHQYRLGSSGDRERVSPPTDLWWMLNESPEPAWTAASWKEWIVWCVKLRGDQHTQILRNMRGEVRGFKVLHPDRVQVRTIDGRLRYDVWDLYTGKAYGVDQDDMLHFTGFGFNGERSMSAIRYAARNAISNSLASASYMGKALTDGGLPRISLETAANMNAQQKDDARAAYAKAYLDNGDGRRFPLVLSNGMKANQLSISAVDLEVMAARRMDKGEICEALGVPPIIIGDSEKNSSWGTGIEQVKQGWVSFVIQPMLARWEEELNRKLFRRAGQFVEFSLAALLRGDSKAQSEAHRAALGGAQGDGWMSVNEVRKLQNLPALDDPEADKPYKANRATAASQPPANP